MTVDRPLPALSPRPLPAAHRAALRQELLDTVRGGTPTAGRRRRRVYASAGFAAAIVATGGAVAYSQLGAAPVTDHSSARCYTQARYDSDTPGTTVGTPDYTTKDGKVLVKGEVRNALDICADLFRQGFLQVGSTRLPAIEHPGPSADRPVPPLVECVLPDGTAAVFPGTGDLCTGLGLAELAPVS